MPFPSACDASMDLTFKFWQMRRAFPQKDKLYHCLSHCYMSRACGRPESEFLGKGNEYFDTVRGLFGTIVRAGTGGFVNPTGSFIDPANRYDQKDEDANEHGRSCPTNLTCWERCKQYAQP